MKAIRTQADDVQELLSQLSGLDCSQPLENGEPNLDRARQEDAKDADINEILTRFGVDTFQQKTPIFTESDFDLDLQTALGAIASAKEVHKGMPPEIKKIYPTWRSMLNAANTGDLEKDLRKLEKELEAKKTKVVPPDAPPKEVTKA